jgi:hypothetical protein
MFLIGSGMSLEVGNFSCHRRLRFLFKQNNKKKFI